MCGRHSFSSASVARQVLRYVYANPRAAGMIAGDEYAYSNICC